jgi:hypothetical protein
MEITLRRDDKFSKPRRLFHELVFLFRKQVAYRPIAEGFDMKALENLDDMSTSSSSRIRLSPEIHNSR